MIEIRCPICRRLLGKAYNDASAHGMLYQCQPDKKYHSTKKNWLVSIKDEKVNYEVPERPEHAS